jgi:hypothetical protein
MYLNSIRKMEEEKKMIYGAQADQYQVFVNDADEIIRSSQKKEKEKLLRMQKEKKDIDNSEDFDLEKLPFFMPAKRIKMKNTGLFLKHRTVISPN